MMANSFYRWQLLPYISGWQKYKGIFLVIAWIFTWTVSCSLPVVWAEKVDSSSTVEEEKWWEKRNQRKDIYYPHQIHMQAMDKEGDSCMLCHTFAPNSIKNEKNLQRLNVIANEPLEAICHDCHLDDVRAPWRCDLCHPDKTTIWPDDHNDDYIHAHNEDARMDETQCRSCHLDMNFCSDCHFRRSDSQVYHPLGYQSRHGIDARMNTGQCGRCHNAFYCSNCHRYKK